MVLKHWLTLLAVFILCLNISYAYRSAITPTSALYNEKDPIYAGDKANICYSNGTGCPSMGSNFTYSDYFDQSLNTTDSPQFNHVVSTQGLGGNYNASLGYLEGTPSLFGRDDGLGNSIGSIGIPLQSSWYESMVFDGNGALFLQFNPGSQPGSSVQGRMYYDDTDNIFKYYDGSNWVNISNLSSETDPLYSANTYAVNMNQGVSSSDSPSFNTVWFNGYSNITSDSSNMYIQTPYGLRINSLDSRQNFFAFDTQGVPQFSWFTDTLGSQDTGGHRWAMFNDWGYNNGGTGSAQPIEVSLDTSKVFVSNNLSVGERITQSGYDVCDSSGNCGGAGIQNGTDAYLNTLGLGAGTTGTPASNIQLYIDGTGGDGYAQSVFNTNGQDAMMRFEDGNVQKGEIIYSNSNGRFRFEYLYNSAWYPIFEGDTNTGDLIFNTNNAPMTFLGSNGIYFNNSFQTVGINDTSNLISIDSNNRALFANDGITVPFRWEQQTGGLYGGNSPVGFLNLINGTLSSYSMTDKVSVDYVNRILFVENGSDVVPAVDWTGP
jgi:hypothetical protein